MLKRGRGRSEKSPNRKKKRPLLNNVSTPEPIPRPSPTKGADDASGSDEEEEYQFHSMLRTSTGSSQTRKPPSSAPKQRHQKSSKNVQDKRVNISAPAVEMDVRDCESAPVLVLSDSDTENRPAEAADGLSTTSSTWQCSKQNAEEIHRGEVGDMEVAVYRIKGSGVALGGSGWVKVIRGSARVLGALLTVRNAPFFIASAPLAPFAMTVTPYTPMPDTERSLTGADWLEARCKDFLSSVPEKKLKCSADACVILFAENCEPNEASGSLSSEALDAIGADVPHTVQKYSTRSGLPSTPSGKKLVRGLNVLDASEKLPCFTLWSEWDSVVRRVHNFLRNSKHASDMRILVCGPGGTGKSTAVRCIINSLLSWNKEVVLIDTDVGQPEMNLPGLIAAHSVRRFRSGAAAVGNRNVPIEGGYFGDLTPREDVNLYTKCVSRVIASGCKYAEKFDCPVIVNSDGWVSDTGADLLSMVAKKVSPSHVVAMKFSESLENSTISDLLKTIQMDCAFELISPLQSRNSFYSGSMLRDLHITTYFCGVLDKGVVFELELDSVQIATIGESIPRSMMFAALNACVIAIASSNGRRSMDEWNTFGFGIVRGVDVSAGRLYVATPLSGERLENCDAIIVSSGIQVPSGLFLAMAECAVPCIKPPYIEANVVSTGGQMKSRPSLLRK